MTAKFRSLLPPGAFHEERAQEQASAEQIATLDTNMVRKSKNPDTCPAHLLPWLAWEHAVDFWDDGWTEAQKRQVIKDAAYVHQHRGTAGAVRRSLGSVNLPTTVVEWWEDTPRAEGQRGESRRPHAARFALGGVPQTGFLMNNAAFFQNFTGVSQVSMEKGSFR